MLSEKINLLQQRAISTKTCHFANTVSAMPQSDRDALIDALVTGSVSMRALERLLSEEGFRIGRDSLNKGRMCALNNQICKCGFMNGASR